MILGDCLDVMPTLPKASAQLVFCDAPYVCTANSWDIGIDLDRLWQGLTVCSSRNTPCIFTATTLFASKLIKHSRKPYRYDLVWHKSHPTGFLNANRMPLRAHELILMFYDDCPFYSPQMTKTTKRQGDAVRGSLGVRTSYTGLRCGGKYRAWVEDGTRHPTSVVSVPSINKQKVKHPTQKPTALLDWLIRSYSRSACSVLDPTAGHMTTCVSACSNGRSSVGIELNPDYFAAGVARVQDHCRRNLLDVKIEVIT